MKFLLLIVALISVSMTTPVPAEYKWNKNYKVKLSDFQVDKNIDAHKLASIFTGVGLYSVRKNSVYSFTAYSMANRKLSVMCEKTYQGYRLKEVLDHEQIHFDISEYIARRLNAQLVDVRDPKLADKLFADYMDTLGTIQVVYDAQTNHSNDSLWQVKWRTNIDRLLSKDIPDPDWKMYPY
jgi:hypothetical protein